MRIIFVVATLTGGGVERMVAVFSNALADMREEVYILSSQLDEDDYAVNENVHIHLWNCKPVINITIPKVRELCKILAPLLQMPLQIRRISGDVIIPFSLAPKNYIWIILATVFSKTRLVYAVRNNEQRKNQKRMDSWIKKLVRCYADGIWIQTADQGASYSKRLQKKMFEVHNILDSRFLDIPRATRKRIYNFINVGRLNPQKNQKMLVQAFAKMVARTGNQDATLTIFGKGRELEREVRMELEDLIRCHHLDGRVFLPGRVTNIEEKYEEADVFILSSDYEGCPNALMEAMAAGLPCISTDCPTGPSYLIEHGKTGILVPVGDVDQMSLAIETLVNNPELANQMGAAAKQRMKEWESPEKLAEQLLTNLKRICS